jgi:hypothetical protein
MPEADTLANTMDEYLKTPIGSDEALARLALCWNMIHGRPPATAVDIPPPAVKTMPTRQVKQGGRKLTPQQVQAIRERLEAGQTQASIARAFRVSVKTVNHINTGKAWRTVGWAS